MHSDKAAMRAFTAIRTGSILRMPEGQRIFRFDLPYAEHARRLPPGIGLTEQDGVTRKT
jgi:hypothetical protein